MRVQIPKLKLWTQISGDMNPGDYGALLARTDEYGDALELLEIQPVREYIGDGEAAEVGFPFWSRESYYTIDDLDPDDRDVRAALRFSDLENKLGEFPPTERALAIAEAMYYYGIGVDEGPSGWSADVFPDKAKYWAGTFGPEEFEDADDAFRVDVLGEEWDDVYDED